MKKFKPKKATKDRYAYVFEKDKKELIKIKNKYHVSISTMIDIVANTPKIAKAIILTHDNNIYNESVRATFNIIHVKPKENEYWHEDLQRIEFFTNVLHYIAIKFKGLMIEEKENLKLYTMFINECQKRKESYWDLNERIRTNKRALKILGAK